MDATASANTAMIALAGISNVTGSFLFYLVIGVMPCLIWLFFYLMQDRHPEPKKEILIVFLLGALMTAPAVWMEISLINIFSKLGMPAPFSVIIYNIVAVAFVEEFAKYYAVWLREQASGQNRNLDEPVDFVIYMVVSALGFAAVENLLFLLPVVQDQLLGSSTLLQPDGMFALTWISSFRSISAILLHTLCSGVVGYYMAMSFCHRERKTWLLATGFVIVSCLHGIYNFSIMESENNILFFFVPLLILFSMALTLFFQFEWLSRMKSVCNMKIERKNKEEKAK